MLNIIVFLCLLLTVRGYGSLCVKHNKSCSTQLWDNSFEDDRCQMVYYGLHSEKCDLKEYKLSSSLTDLGSVKLEPYENKHSGTRTTFNVTMYNIKWKYLKMRFKERQSACRCMCRDFYIASEEIVASHKVLHYDCPWSDASFEGKLIDFEFEYGNGKDVIGKKYTFFVPRQENLYESNSEINLTNLQLFTYIEQSDSRNLILKIQVPPEKYHVERLFVEVFRARNNLTNKEDVRIVSTSDAKLNEIQFVYNTFGEHGAYSFVVRFDHPLCNTKTCMVTRTPLIIIPETSNVLTIGIVGIVGLIPIIFIVLFIWRRQCLKLDMVYRLNQSILLVSFPPNDSHVNVVSILAQLLKHSLRLNVMLDIIDVPKTESKDPFEWFTTAFHNATHVVFLLSQKRFTSTKIVYKDIDNLALYLLKEELASKSPSKQFSLITFPYSSTDIPVQLSNLRTFKFMDDFGDFLNYLRRKQFWLRLEETIDILGDEMHNELKDAIKQVEKSMDFNDETQHWNNCDFVESKEMKCVLPDIFKLKDKPEKRNKNEYIYNVNEMDLTGNKEDSKENRLKDRKQDCFDVNDLEL